MALTTERFLLARLIMIVSRFDPSQLGAACGKTREARALGGVAVQNGSCRDVVHILATMESQSDSVLLRREKRIKICSRNSGGTPGPNLENGARCPPTRDSGPGVPPELREQIFNPFFTSKKDGVGLGLSIVARSWTTIAADPFGTATPPRGARFRVFFPSRTRVTGVERERS